MATIKAVINWFKTFRLQMGLRLLKRKMGREKMKRRSQMLVEAKTIGVLYSARNNRDEDRVKQFCNQLRQPGRTIYCIGYLQPDSKDSTLLQYCSHPYFEKKECNFWNIPSADTVRTFMRRELDLLINLDSEHQFPLAWMACLSKARFRVGRYHPDLTFCYELMVDTRDDSDPVNLMKEIRHYLEQIKEEKDVKIA